MGGRRRVLGGVAGTVVACVIAAGALPNRAVPPAGAAPEPIGWLFPFRVTDAYTNPALGAALLAMLNRARVHAGRGPVAPLGALQRAAAAYGREIFATGYFAHVSSNGLTPLERIEAAGLAAKTVGENLAYAPNIRAAQAAMMASPAHRRNILYPSFRFVGIGVADGGHWGLIIVEDFAGAVRAEMPWPTRGAGLGFVRP